MRRIVLGLCLAAAVTGCRTTERGSDSKFIIMKKDQRTDGGRGAKGLRLLGEGMKVHVELGDSQLPREPVEAYVQKGFEIWSQAIQQGYPNADLKPAKFVENADSEPAICIVFLRKILPPGKRSTRSQSSFKIRPQRI